MNHVYRVGWFDEGAAVGIKDLTPHELRHTAASLAVSAGADVKAVQRMLGHASAEVTLDLYADLYDDDLDGVATALNATAMQTNVANLLPLAAWGRSSTPWKKHKIPGTTSDFVVGDLSEI